MENYPILFPIHQASSSSPSTSFHHSPHPPSMFGGTQVFGSLHGGNNSSSTGLLGLLKDHEIIKETTSSQGVDGVKSFAASTTEDEVMTKTTGNDNNNKMKKEKKVKKVKKPRYAFQTRSQVDILDDGYRWRKYGQKAVKNNKFPRSYYRCTHQGCNVKKQVQRLSRDESIVVTTYEGMHSHPIEKPHDNFEDILNQMQIYSNF